MSGVRFWRGALLASGLLSVMARADLYSAARAYESKDYPRAFDLYSELAELGQLDAQENLAAMYVGGEGVKRDNVLGYAWALIAQEHGGGEMSKGIVEQLKPHLTPTAQVRTEELKAQFGQMALEERLLPLPRPEAASTPVVAHGCTFARPANPDNYYPQQAIRAGVSGATFIEFTIAPDGRAHQPRAWYSLPDGVFDEAARRVVFNSTFNPQIENGVPVPCTMRIQVKFLIHPNAGSSANSAPAHSVPDVKAKAEAGDPASQVLYAMMINLRPELHDEHSLPWFLKSAQAGIPLAQFMVGMDTFSGVATSRDEKKGLFWLQKASDGGSAKAQATLANYLMRGQPDAATIAKVQVLLEHAAAAGYRDGKFQLAALLAAGPDTAHLDPKRALDLINEAMDEGDSDPTPYEIRAAAYAMLGEFEDARKSQNRALQKARKIGWDTGPQKARMAAYESNKSWTGSLIVD